MAYYATSPDALEGDPTPENRVWGFFADPNKSRLPNRLQSPQPRRKNRATTTRTVSGIPLWPSRDPIQERGGVNLYGFNFNQPTNYYDVLGEAPQAAAAVAAAALVGATLAFDAAAAKAEEFIGGCPDKYADGTVEGATKCRSCTDRWLKASFVSVELARNLGKADVAIACGAATAALARKNPRAALVFFSACSIAGAELVDGIADLTIQGIEGTYEEAREKCCPNSKK